MIIGYLDPWGKASPYESRLYGSTNPVKGIFKHLRPVKLRQKQLLLRPRRRWHTAPPAVRV